MSEILWHQLSECSIWYPLFATLTADSVVHQFDVAVVCIVSLLSFVFLTQGLVSESVDLYRFSWVQLNLTLRSWCQTVQVDSWLCMTLYWKSLLIRDCVGFCTESHCEFLVWVYSVQKFIINEWGLEWRKRVRRVVSPLVGGVDLT